MLKFYIIISLYTPVQRLNQLNLFIRYSICGKPHSNYGLWIWTMMGLCRYCCIKNVRKQSYQDSYIFSMKLQLYIAHVQAKCTVAENMYMIQVLCNNSVCVQAACTACQSTFRGTILAYIQDSEKLYSVHVCSGGTFFFTVVYLTGSRCIGITIHFIYGSKGPGWI